GARDTIPTGIPHLDFAMGGGLGRGELGILLAPPKRGKSTFLVNVAFGAVCAGYNVVFYTFEMGSKQVSGRMDDRIMLSNGKLKLTNPMEYLELLEGEINARLKGNIIIKKYPEDRHGVSTLDRHLKLEEANGFKADLIVVDYADLMRPESKLQYGSRHQDVEGIYRDLRAMAG
ncbi:MAG: hypothetical protein GY869_09385, partial [Planctomycetes bacterium]|nr:hypothetical protein [Planctomycetota bacterium]